VGFACISASINNRIDLSAIDSFVPTFPLHFGSHESLVTNQSVSTARGGEVSGIAGELRSPGNNPVIFQEGTCSGNDGIHRWMASIAIIHLRHRHELQRLDKQDFPAYRRQRRSPGQMTL
jgi:hypothetical protein